MAIKYDFECLHCEADINMNDYPDHMRDTIDSRFDFTCEDCGASFKVFVEYDPVFYVEEETLITPPHPNTTPQ